VKWTVVAAGPAKSRVLLGEQATGAEVLTPVYVPSFSSFGDLDFVPRSLAVLRSVKDSVPPSASGFLFSAHDLAASARRGGVLDRQLEELLRGWSLWWLDNGAFEQNSFGIPSWAEKEFENVVRRFKPPVVVASEYVAEDGTPGSLAESLRLSVRSAGRLKGLSDSIVVLLRPYPGSDLRPLVNALDLPRILDQGDTVDALGVPELSLGPTLDVRLSAVSALRTELDKLGIPKGLHIFGASDPSCLTAYTLAGADMFDGLNWSRYWMDFTNPSFRDRSLWSPLPGAEGYSPENHDVHLAVHNVASVHRWMNRLRDLVLGRRDASAEEQSIINRLNAVASVGA